MATVFKVLIITFLDDNGNVTNSREVKKSVIPDLKIIEARAKLTLVNQHTCKLMTPWMTADWVVEALSKKYPCLYSTQRRTISK